MLHFPETRIAEASAAASQSETETGVLNVERLLAAVRRQRWVIAGCAIVGLTLGVVYVVTAVPRYTADTDILIDKSISRVADELAQPPGLFQDDAEMLSRVELLKSIHMAEAVVDKLDLVNNERFMVSPPSLPGRLIGSIKSAIAMLPIFGEPADIEPVDREGLRQQAATTLVRNVDVSRVGTTYVINLAYTSTDAGLAASIARGYADAFLDDQLQAKYDATRRASLWLQDRLTELKQQSYTADLAVQNFRSANGLISANGQLVSEQQLSEINTQLITAQTATAEAKARVDQIDALVKSGRTDAVVNDALVSSTINTLREKYLDASRREAEIASRLGENHVQARRLRDQMTEFERLIFSELGRIADSYRNAYNVALSRQKSLEENLSGAVNVSALNNTTQVQLRELEREAEAYKNLYESFLKRYQETIQQQSFPITEARIISAPSKPNAPSKPKKPMLLALFTFLGLGAGAGLAGWREHRERFFRVGDQVRRETNQEFLGYLPLVRTSRAAEKAAVVSTEGSGGGLWSQGSPNGYLRISPMSSYAETLRNVKVAADLSLTGQPSRVIGVVSCLPSEGKSTTAANLATLLSMQDTRALLIDGDLRNPGLTRSMERKPDSGLVEAIIAGGDIASHIRWDTSGRMAILPAVVKRRISHSSELLGSANMARVLEEAKSQFDYVVVDLPPLGAIIDAKAFAHRVDAFVFVVEWGRTSRHMVRTVLEANPTIRNKSLGIVLSKSDNSKMRYYRSYGSSEYYAPRYESYYRD